MWEHAETLRGGRPLEGLTDATGYYQASMLPLYLSFLYDERRHELNNGKHIFPTAGEPRQDGTSLVVAADVLNGRPQIDNIRRDQERNWRFIGGISLFDYMRGGLEEIESATGVSIRTFMDVESAIHGLMDADLINSDFGWSVLNWAANPPSEVFTPENRIRPDGTPHVQ
jgi:hypothetical protein